MGMNVTPLLNESTSVFSADATQANPALSMPSPDRSLPIVSNVKGTTTDPVYKTMELLPWTCYGH